ncbi:ankyrin repeat domain-containing protein [bacterium]|nr:ankyrin repeat domain-containing protein [bacterium]
MKNPYIIPAAMICASILAGFWMLKPPSEQPQKVTIDASPKAPAISIHDAAGGGNIEAVKQHLAAGTDVNAKDKGGGTPLHFAATKEIAELLIAKGADVNAKDGFLMAAPLHYAANEGRKEVVELLIAAGADVNAKDGSGSIPLHHAAQTGLYEVSKLLITKGADVNMKNNPGQTPLDRAIYNKQTATTNLLRKHGGKTGAELKAEG